MDHLHGNALLRHLETVMAYNGKMRERIFRRPKVPTTLCSVSVGTGKMIVVMIDIALRVI